MSKYLEAPDIIEQMEDADEIVRVWIGEGDSIVTLNDLFGEDTHNWGMVLADIAIHVGRMKAGAGSAPLEDTLKEVEDGYRGRMADFHSLHHQTLSGRN